MSTTITFNDLEFLAKQGESDAQYELFRFFDKENRHDEKIDWLKKAARSGSDKAQYQLGLSYQYGWHIKKNLDLAISWFLLAAKQQYLDSMSQLGFIYAQQGGISKEVSNGTPGFSSIIFMLLIVAMCHLCIRWD